MVGIGEHQMAHALRDERNSPLAKSFTARSRMASAAAHVLDIFLAGLDRRQRIEIDGVGVVPAEIISGRSPSHYAGCGRNSRAVARRRRGSPANWIVSAISVAVSP